MFFENFPFSIGQVVFRLNGHDYCMMSISYNKQFSDYESISCYYRDHRGYIIFASFYITNPLLISKSSVFYILEKQVGKEYYNKYRINEDGLVDGIVILEKIDSTTGKTYFKKDFERCFINGSEYNYEEYCYRVLPHMSNEEKTYEKLKYSDWVVAE